MKRVLSGVGAVLLALGMVAAALASGKPTTGSGNHGSAVAPVAQSSCVAANPHNPNAPMTHGQCVANTANKNRSGASSGSGTTKHSSKTKHNTKTKHHTKTHKSKKTKGSGKHH